MTPQPSLNAVELAPFKELLQNTCGFLFENERETTLIEGLCRRMTLCGEASPEEYRQRLAQEPKEMHLLVELLTINETYFFREPEQLRLIQQLLVPEIMAKGPQRPVRILSAGCSTGEEPYSIAIMLREAFGPDSMSRFSIAGVDIDASALAAARRGRYGRGSFRGMDQYLMSRYFTADAAGERHIAESIRSQVSFEQVNLLAGEYPPLMQAPDIILYRNVSIYFPGQIQRNIFSRLAESLNEDGYLFVSATETMHHNIGVLSLLQKGPLFVYRKVPPLTVIDRRQTRRSPPLCGPQKGQATPSKARPGPRTARADAASLATPAASARAAEPSPEQLFDEALDRAQNKRPEEALALLDELLAKGCPSAKPYALKGAILLELARFQEAKEVCRQTLARNPLSMEAPLMLGIIARHEADNDEAFRRFREALYVNAACWPAHFFIAEGLAAQGQKKRARNGYETVVRILEQGALNEHDRELFPLTFKAEHFLAMCRHKLSLL